MPICVWQSTAFCCCWWRSWGSRITLVDDVSSSGVLAFWTSSSSSSTTDDVITTCVQSQLSSVVVAVFLGLRGSVVVVVEWELADVSVIHAQWYFRQRKRQRQTLHNNIVQKTFSVKKMPNTCNETKPKIKWKPKIQEALLLQRNRATRYVSWNIMAVYWLSYWQEALLIPRNHASTLSVEIV